MESIECQNKIKTYDSLFQKVFELLKISSLPELNELLKKEQLLSRNQIMQNEIIQLHNIRGSMLKDYIKIRIKYKVD